VLAALQEVQAEISQLGAEVGRLRARVGRSVSSVEPGIGSYIRESLLRTNELTPEPRLKDFAASSVGLTSLSAEEREHMRTALEHFERNQRSKEDGDDNT
jgi:hypothetical protein